VQFNIDFYKRKGKREQESLVVMHEQSSCSFLESTYWNIFIVQFLYIETSDVGFI